ncbi:MAG: hypothetical protein K2O37_05745 [Bacteroidales bacterium]|nr:hypothetical protein [Bacteroidales bacterium]
MFLQKYEKPRAEPNLFGLSLGIGEGQARLDDAETEGQSQARLLGSAEAQYLQRSEAKLKVRKIKFVIYKNFCKFGAQSTNY